MKHAMPMSDDSESRVPHLLDGRPAATAQALLALLDDLSIAHTTVSHDPVFTVDEARAVRGDLIGSHSKNLFLRNKAGRMWLVTCEESRRLDLKSLAQRLGAKRFSFASAERLMHYLGVSPGAVTPFAVMNDHTNAVTMVVDSALLRDETVNFHPLVNSMTTSLSGPDLSRFLSAVSHEPICIDFD